MNIMEQDNGRGEGEEGSADWLEKDFQEVASELAGERSLDLFRVEYEKLVKALRTSRGSQRRLMSKCRELNAERVSQTARVTTALTLSQEDQKTALKKEIEEALKMSDTAHDMEIEAKEKIVTLKQEITKLSKLVEEGASSMGPDHGDVLRVREELSREMAELLATVATLRESLAEASSTQQQLETQRDAAMDTLTQKEQELLARQKQISMETLRKKKLDMEVKQLYNDMEAKMADIKAVSLLVQRSREEQQRLQIHLRDMEKEDEQLKQMTARNTRLKEENDKHSLTFHQLTLENQQNAAQLQMKEEEVSEMRQELARLAKLREAIHTKLLQAEEEKEKAEEQREELKTQIERLEREIQASQKQAEVDKKATEELLLEREILNKSLSKGADSTERQQQAGKLQEQVRRSLEQEIQSSRLEAQRQRQIIYQLERNRDHCINQASQATQKVLEQMDDIKVRETEIFEYNKKISEVESKIRQQQNLFEAIRTQRNLYSKNLNEGQEEISELRWSVRLKQQQSFQLKEEISLKEASLVKQQQEFNRLEESKKGLQAKLQMARQQAEETRRSISNQEAERRKLVDIITDAEAEQSRQKRHLEQVVSERDGLACQLLRSNEELALLYDKMKLQQSLLVQGDCRYWQHDNHIHRLKREISRLRAERSILDKTVSSVEELRREVFHLQRELLRSRKTCSDLEEQLDTPHNIHRWKRLEASDPDRYHLILKTHSLQRRLINKTQELADKQLLIQEKEKLYVDLKLMMARQAGPEAEEQLLQQQQTLREKNKKHQALVVELNLCDSETRDNKEEIQKLDEELQNIKKKYLSLKRKEQHSREKRSATQAEQPTVQLTGPGLGSNQQPQPLPSSSDESSI